MTTVSPKKGHDPSRVNEISAKLMENPEIAELIGELSTSVDDASDLVKGLLQASINAGLQAEMDAPFGVRTLRSCGESPGMPLKWWQSPQRVVHEDRPLGLRHGGHHSASG